MLKQESSEKALRKQTEENWALTRDNGHLRQKTELDSTHLNSLTAENKELNAQMSLRLENIRKLISRNEQLTSQSKVLKVRHKKQIEEEKTAYEKSLGEKQSEVDVLKQMIKSSNVQLKAREKDQVRLKKQMVHLEGKNLADRLR